MTKNQIDISELLCSRLCHDIVAPIGAINSGLELLQETREEDKTEIFDLLVKSAESATRKLTLFRFAFGASSIKQIAQLAEVSGLLNQVIDTDKFQLTADLINFNTQQPVKWAKLILQTTMAIVESAPYGGKLNVITSPDTIQILLFADRIIDNQANVDLMQNGCALSDLTPRNVGLYLINNLLNELGVALTKTLGDGMVTYQLKVKIS